MDPPAHVQGVFARSRCFSFYLPLFVLELEFLGQEKNARGNEISSYMHSVNEQCESVFRIETVARADILGGEYDSINCTGPATPLTCPWPFITGDL